MAASDIDDLRKMSRKIAALDDAARACEYGDLIHGGKAVRRED